MDLSPGKIAWSDKTAEERITKAGYRVAAVLEAIWPDKKIGFLDVFSGMKYGQRNPNESPVG